MDRLIYTAANGANRILDAQASIANNMANVSTPGFREQLSAYRSVPVTNGSQDPAQTTRVMTVAVTSPSLFEQGSTLSTGRSLDAAIDGQGWFAVRTADGGEAYTRAGNFTRNANGQLVDNQGRAVISADGGVIDLGDADRVSFSRDGGINVIPQGGKARDVQRIAQLKLVNPQVSSLTRGEDGLFRVIDPQGRAQEQVPDAQVRVLGGSLEASNVSAAQAMVKMIENARRYELQMKFISDASSNEQSANSILSVSN
jgi:flagellar basal-body rod protein FlgF